VRPIFDWRAMQRQINEENAVPDRTEGWI